ncbi:MAG TPA: tetratricopeptide repeat protein [Pyrinomonadaceae bacterium]|nr:tetratricopeptide repeat protein [Pyrinomonadaceae bacterium]
MKKAAPLLLSLAVCAALTQIQTPTAAAHALAAHTSLYPAIILQGRNSITVRVFGPTRNPISDIYVELQNDTYSTVGRGKTDGAGRVTFPGLSEGTFKVRALPLGTDYMEQTLDVSIYNISRMSGGGASSEQVDMYLKVRENGNSSPFSAPPGTVFAQAVPEPARKLYEQGISDLRDKKEKEGFQNLRNALEIFPTYYLAMERLGTEYVMRGPAYHEAARILLTKALEVNPKGFPSTFGLGIAQYQLKMTNDAVDTLRRATTLHPNSVNAYMWLGMALKQAKKTDEAETALKRANDVGKGKAAEVHFQLARLYSEQNRYQEAADSMELYLKHRQDNPDKEKIKQTIELLRAKAAKK